MKDQLETLQSELKKHGYSMTNARTSVFLAMLDKEPLSIQELVRTTSGKINRSSLYRVIELFELLGIVDRLQIGWKYKLELSDAFASHHHHMSCLNCGQVAAFEENRVIEFELKQLALERGFKPTGHQLEIRGICQTCQQSSKP
jgi:Fur family ferric uptake transcriptional regulator